MSAGRALAIAMATCVMCAHGQAWSQEPTPNEPEVSERRTAEPTDARRPPDDVPLKPGISPEDEERIRARSRAAGAEPTPPNRPRASDETQPVVVERSTLNEEPPLSDEETKRFGPARALDPRQMLFEPGERIERPPETAAPDDPTAEIQERVAQEITERRTSYERKLEIAARLRRVMELGRNPR